MKGFNTIMLCNILIFFVLCDETVYNDEDLNQIIDFDFDIDFIKSVFGPANKNTTEEIEFDNWFTKQTEILVSTLKNISLTTLTKSQEKESLASYESELINNIFRNISSNEDLKFTKRKEWIIFEEDIRESLNNQFNVSLFDANNDGFLDEEEQKNFTSSFVKNISHTINDILNTSEEIEDTMDEDTQIIDFDFDIDFIKSVFGPANKNTTEEIEFDNWFAKQTGILVNTIKNASLSTLKNSKDKESLSSYLLNESQLINNIFKNISSNEDFKFTKRQEWIIFEEDIRESLNDQFNVSLFDTNKDGFLDKEEQKNFTSSVVKDISHSINQILKSPVVQELINIPNHLSYINKNHSLYFSEKYYNESNKCGKTYSCLSCVDDSANIKYDKDNKVIGDGKKICDQCIPPYFLDLTSSQPQCMPCEDLNCEKCSPKTGICDKCQKGKTNFALDYNYKYKDIHYATSFKYHCRDCNTVIPFCKECDMVDCLNCEEEYYLHKGKCLKGFSGKVIIAVLIVLFVILLISIILFIFKKKGKSKNGFTKANADNLDLTDGKSPQIFDNNTGRTNPTLNKVITNV